MKITWIARLSSRITVFAAVTSWTETLISCIGWRFLAYTTIIARIIGASFASGDANAVRLIPNKIDLLLAQHESTDAADESHADIGVFVDRVIIGNTTDV